MTVRALACPNCGAPLPEHAWKTRVTCAYCHSAVTIDRVRVDAASFVQIDKETKDRALKSGGGSGNVEAERVEISGETYFLRGRIAQGESSDVFLGERAWPPSLVVVKVLRADTDRDLFFHEETVLRELGRDLGDFPGLARRIPQIVQSGHLSSDATRERPAMALRYMSGFVHTLNDVRAEHGDGLDPHHVVWIWRRILELLNQVHALGRVHGALVPAHLLVHARDHGVNVVGWSSAGELGRERRAVSPELEAIDPKGDLLGKPLSPAVDLATSARTMLSLYPDHGRLPGSLRDLLHSAARLEFTRASALETELMATARTLFGPPSYQKLVMPGWP